MKKMQNAKKSKRIIALFIIAAMLGLSIIGAAGCARDEDDKGAVIAMYLASNPTNINLDPPKLLYSAEAVKYLGLMFEGLTVIDDKGKLGKGIANSWTYYQNEKGEYIMEFELKDTKWSDGIAVTAQDFVYAWKRILEPEFSSQAAALLFDIKNARAVKAGDMTVDDLGVYEDDATMLRVVFEGDIDYERFLRNLASPALVPLRGDAVDYIDQETGKTWTEVPGTFLSNGNFEIKQMDSKAYMFQRSTYYMLKEKAKDIFKYVTPYKLVMDMEENNLDRMTDAFANDEAVFYLGNVPQARYEEFKDKAVLKDLLSTYTYHFNATKAPFNKPEVRKALSIALDRNEIAKIAGLGVKAATGIVPTGIMDVKTTEDFRKVRGDAISPAGDISGAKSLLSSAGVTPGSFTLSIRDNSETELAVAEYAKGVWEQLGFKVTISLLSTKDVRKDTSKEPKKPTEYETAILSANYDVIGYDDQALGVDSWSVLAPFAQPFCGSKVEFIDEGLSNVSPYITGFQDDGYDALIEEIFALTTAADASKRVEKLAEAEKMLVNLSPVAPLYFNTSINLTSKQLTGLSYSKFGYTIFAKANLKNYQQYTTGATEEETAGATE